ncbi:cyclin-L1-like [Neocloeon triangulifer]|uniref:cyclin-L1-like n=1 Tax=Neocloeon triangulifer TaxID=2078957 RepID=UPI00286F41D5|nr:cyclin-L1-like [Neocloeon triangulifer]XP_059486606.1 cyclin-L1-like [Neocloeon triangulifer]
MTTTVVELNGSTPMMGAPQSGAQQQQQPPIYGKISLQLTNCLLPEEKLSPTPSEQDGLDKEVEIDLRILGCELIQTAGMLLKLPQVAMATAQVLFQRFYYSKSFVRHPMEIFAMGCLCLASKIEEAPRRVRDVINVFSHIKQVDAGKPIAPVVLDQIYSNLKIQVIKAERRVLKELGFCVHVKHPHKIIVINLQMLGFEKNEEFMQYSWNYMNDSLRTNVFVRYDPEAIACACIYLSARKLKIPMSKDPPWYGIFGVKEDDLLDICYSILRLYRRPKAIPDQLEKIVLDLQTKYQETRNRARQAGLLNSANNTPAQNSLSPSTPAIKKPLPEVSPRSKETRRSESPSPHKHKSKSNKKHRHSSTSPSRSRSRSRDRNRKKLKSRNRSLSPASPTSQDYKRSHKTRDKQRYRSRSRSRDRRDRSRSRSYDRYKHHDKSKKHKYRDEGSRKRKEIRR